MIGDRIVHRSRKNILGRFVFSLVLDNIVAATNNHLPAAREPRLRTHPACFYAQSKNQPEISR